MDLKTVLSKGMDAASFTLLLDSLDLTQADFARLGGFSVSTVNRWCSATRGARWPVPRHAILIAAMYSMLPAHQRQAFRTLAS